MEEISVKGEKYIKATILADKFGYTSDYVGQLCRSNQIKATLVGRSWYVNEQSLNEHKRKRYRSNVVKSLKSVQELSQNTDLTPKSRFNRRLASYSSEETDLLPSLKKKELDTEKFLANEVAIENAEKKALNNALSRSEEKETPVTENDNSNYSRPNIRIISTGKALQSRVKSDTGVELTKTAIKLEKHHSRKYESVDDYKRKISAKRGTVVVEKPKSSIMSWVVGIFIISPILLVGCFALVAGLEKRIVVLDNGQNLVLYNFNNQSVLNCALKIKENILN